MSKKLQVYHTPEIAVTFDPNICIHSAVCIGGLPAVFDVSRADWIRPAAASAEAVEALVAKCPSGALQSVRAGHPRSRPAAPSTETAITFRSDGPALLQGPVEVRLPSGGTERREGSVAFCRCGRTKNDPYCDGSHGPTGFRSPR